MDSRAQRSGWASPSGGFNLASCSTGTTEAQASDPAGTTRDSSAEHDEHRVARRDLAAQHDDGALRRTGEGEVLLEAAADDVDRTVVPDVPHDRGPVTEVEPDHACPAGQPRRRTSCWHHGAVTPEPRRTAGDRPGHRTSDLGHHRDRVARGVDVRSAHRGDRRTGAGDRVLAQRHGQRRAGVPFVLLRRRRGAARARPQRAPAGAAGRGAAGRCTSRPGCRPSP